MICNNLPCGVAGADDLVLHGAVTDETIAYWAPQDFADDLAGEIARAPNLKVMDRTENLFLCKGTYCDLAWSQWTWRNCQFLKFESIGEAVKLLKERGGLWCQRSLAKHRRAQLILDQLKSPSHLPREFSQLGFPRGQLGAYCLTADKELFYSRDLLPSVAGDVRFVETSEPPSRAYLKLWEVMSVYGCIPQRGAKCLEIGASPGGWSWVLSQLGCEVWALDRSPLEPKLMKNSLIHFKAGDAFVASPRDYPQVKWVFSDIICYPEKLLEWLQPWIAQPEVNLVCTVKFQGATDYDTMDLFRAVPRSRLVHLQHNKHELTWFRV